MQKNVYNLSAYFKGHNMTKKYLITSALPYVNNNLHIGHLIGCWLPSDVYARFCRAMGRDVLYVCGADEHGTTSEVGARKENMPIEQYVDKNGSTQTVVELIVDNARFTGEAKAQSGGSYTPPPPPEPPAYSNHPAEQAGSAPMASNGNHTASDFETTAYKKKGMPVLR